MVGGTQPPYRLSLCAGRVLNVQALAKELVTLHLVVIFAQSSFVTAALDNQTHTILIVFTFVIDPVGAGFVPSSPVPR